MPTLTPPEVVRNSGVDELVETIARTFEARNGGRELLKAVEESGKKLVISSASEPSTLRQRYWLSRHPA